MTRAYDIIVLGLGAIGSATLWRLSRRPGLRLLGLDRWAPPHPHGSSHGDSRMTRLALGEGPAYTAMVLQANQLWRELETASGQTLRIQTGGLIVGDTRSDAGAHGVSGFLQQTVAMARQFHIPHDRLDAPDLRRRYPQLRFADHDQGYIEPGAGYLRADACVQAMLSQARHAGAHIQTDAPLIDIQPTADGGLSIRTANAEYRAPRAIACLGPWTGPLLGPPFDRLLTVYPQFLAWYPLAAGIDGRQLPAWVRLPDSQRGLAYGFPAIGAADTPVKIATEHVHSPASPDAEPPDHQAAADQLARDAAQTLPLAPNTRAARIVPCKYTVTPDSGFIIDHHPRLPHLTVVSACSGHAFKHAPAIGQLATDLATHSTPTLDPSPFRLSRFHS